MYWWTKSSALTSSRGEFPAIAALLMMMSIWNLPDLRKISESAFPPFGRKSSPQTDVERDSSISG